MPRYSSSNGTETRINQTKVKIGGLKFKSTCTLLIEYHSPVTVVFAYAYVVQKFGPLILVYLSCLCLLILVSSILSNCHLHRPAPPTFTFD